MNDAFLDDELLRKLFVASGALLAGHFKLSSGRHSGQYFQCARVLTNTASAERLGAELAERIPDDWKPETVVSPALGGIIIGHEVARARRLRSLFAERKEGAMALRRGFAVAKGERVVVVEDVVTTGKSTGEVLAVLRGLGAEPAGVLCLVLRAERPPELGVPIRRLAHWPATTFAPSECPLCKEGRPIEQPGSRGL